jgi:hypothetical protein
MCGIHNSVGSDRSRLRATVVVLVTAAAAVPVAVVLVEADCSDGTAHAPSSTAARTTNTIRITAPLWAGLLM